MRQAPAQTQTEAERPARACAIRAPKLGAIAEITSTLTKAAGSNVESNSRPVSSKRKEKRGCALRWEPPTGLAIKPSLFTKFAELTDREIANNSTTQ